MGRSRHWVVAIVLLGPSWSCGGTVSSGSESADGGASDAALVDTHVPHDAGTSADASADSTVVDSTVPPDAGPSEFCAGASKVASGTAMIEPVAVTSSMLVMDCCEGFLVRLHTQPELGVNLSVMVRAFGAITSGDYDVPLDAGSAPQVTITPFDPGKPGQTWASLSASGKLRIDQPSYDQPTHASLCLEVQSPGDPLDGTRLFVPDVVVAPWAWDSRFEIRLLADSSISADAASQAPLDSLELAPEPIVTLMSLAWYDSAASTGYWDAWYGSQAIINQLPDFGVYGLPFVVLADGQRIYLGAFMSDVSSVGLSMPTIIVEQMPDWSFRIEPGYPGGPAPSPDVRNDPRILSVFREASKLVP